MRIPKRLQIAGHTFRVAHEDSVCCDSLGVAQPIGGIIYIRRSIPQQHQESALLHEIIEVLNAFYKLDLDEHRICVLETGLYQVLKDNRLLREEEDA